MLKATQWADTKFCVWIKDGAVTRAELVPTGGEVEVPFGSICSITTYNELDGSIAQTDIYSPEGWLCGTTKQEFTYPET